VGQRTGANRTRDAGTATADPTAVSPVARELVRRNGTGRGVVFTVDAGAWRRADEGRVVAVDRFGLD